MAGVWQTPDDVLASVCVAGTLTLALCGTPSSASCFAQAGPASWRSTPQQCCDCLQDMVSCFHEQRPDLRVAIAGGASQPRSLSSLLPDSWQAWQSHKTLTCAVQRRVPDSEVWVDIKRFSLAQDPPGDLPLVHMLAAALAAARQQARQLADATARLAEESATAAAAAIEKADQRGQAQQALLLLLHHLHQEYTKSVAASHPLPGPAASAPSQGQRSTQQALVDSADESDESDGPALSAPARAGEGGGDVVAQHTLSMFSQSTVEARHSTQAQVPLPETEAMPDHAASMTSTTPSLASALGLRRATVESGTVSLSTSLHDLTSSLPSPTPPQGSGGTRQLGGAKRPRGPEEDYVGALPKNARRDAVPGGAVAGGAAVLAVRRRRARR